MQVAGSSRRGGRGAPDGDELRRQRARERCLRKEKVILRKRRFMGGQLPYGYRLVYPEDGGDPREEIVPEEARLVRLIFYWRAVQRLSLGEIARRATEYAQRHGLEGKNRRGGVFFKTTIASILSNRFYIGWVKWRGSGWVRGRHPTFVPEAWFQQVQDMRLPPGRKPRNGETGAAEPK